MEEKVKESRKHKKSVFNPAVGEFFAMMSQIDEFNQLRAQLRAEQINRKVSAEEQERMDRELKQFLEKDEVKEKYAKIKDTKARLDRVIQKIAELEAKNAAKNSEIKKDQNINKRKEALLDQFTEGGAQSEHQEVSPVVDAKAMAQNFLQISQLQSDAGTAAPQPMIPGVQELLVQETASSAITHSEEYAQAIQEKKSLTKALLDTGVSLKKDIDAFVAENKWAEYAKSGLESLLKGVGYGVAVCAVSTVGAKFGTVAAIATAGGLVISGEATAEIINRSGEQLVDYAVSFADTPEEAAGYADVVISGLETIVTVAGAVGGYKAGKAMVGKLANLKAHVPAKVGEAFGGKANLQTTTTKAEIKAVAGKTTVMKAETAIASQAADSVCQKNVQRNVLDGERHFLTSRRRVTTGPGKTEPLLRRGENPSARPTPRQSEIDDTLRLRKGGQIVEPQVSFLIGERCKCGTPGSIRVDNLVDGRVAHEMKNYDLTSNVNGLIRDIADQAVKHQQHLPKETRQIFKIDTRGQVAPLKLQKTIKEHILSKTQGILSLDDVIFIE